LLRLLCEISKLFSLTATYIMRRMVEATTLRHIEAHSIYISFPEAFRSPAGADSRCLAMHSSFLFDVVHRSIRHEAPGVLKCLVPRIYSQAQAGSTGLLLYCTLMRRPVEEETGEAPPISGEATKTEIATRAVISRLWFWFFSCRGADENLHGQLWQFRRCPRKR
jgi:hypothetical protein